MGRRQGGPSWTGIRGSISESTRDRQEAKNARKLESRLLDFKSSPTSNRHPARYRRFRGKDTTGFGVSTRSCLCSCYRRSCNRPCPCTSSCLCNRCRWSCSHPDPYIRFGLYNRAYLSGHLPMSAEKRPLWSSCSQRRRAPRRIRLRGRPPPRRQSLLWMF